MSVLLDEPLFPGVMHKMIENAFLGLLVFLNIQTAHAQYTYKNLPTFWLDLAYLYWDIQPAPEPIPLLVGTDLSIVGAILRQPDTTILLGDEEINMKGRSGGNLYAGYRFGDQLTYGIEANYFFLPLARKTKTILTTPGGQFQNYYLPYVNAVTGNESSRIIAVANNYGGLVSLKISNKMQGAEVNGLGNIICQHFGHIDLLGGVRYLNFQEDLTYFANLPYVPGSPFPLNIYQVTDQFDTANHFIGPQFGIKTEYFYKKLYIQATGKIAVGALLGSVDIQGSFATNDITGTVSPSVQTFTGGFFALPTNIGTHHTTHFSILPEIHLICGYQPANRLRFQAGYTLLYLTGVLRPGNQIDRNLNTSQSSVFQSTANPSLTGVERPEALMKTSGLWVQGINVAVEFGF